MPLAREVFNFDDLSPPELDAKRREILARADQKFDAAKHRLKYEALDDNDLAELASVCAALRRRGSGPPKEAKSRAAPVKRASLSDLVGDL